MSTLYMLFNWGKELVLGSTGAIWLLSQEVWNGFNILGLLSIGGITAYLSVAVIKWLIS